MVWLINLKVCVAPPIPEVKVTLEENCSHLVTPINTTSCLFYYSHKPNLCLWYFFPIYLLPLLTVTRMKRTQGVPGALQSFEGAAAIVLVTVTHIALQPHYHLVLAVIPIQGFGCTKAIYDC